MQTQVNHAEERHEAETESIKQLLHVSLLFRKMSALEFKVQRFGGGVVEVLCSA